MRGAERGIAMVSTLQLSPFRSLPDLHTKRRSLDVREKMQRERDANAMPTKATLISSCEGSCTGNYIVSTG